MHKPRQVLSPRRRGAVSFLRSVSAFALGSPEPAVLSCAGGALCSVCVHATKKMPLPFLSRPPPTTPLGEGRFGASINITSPTPRQRGALRRSNFEGKGSKADSSAGLRRPGPGRRRGAGVAGGCRAGQPRRACCLLRWAALQTGALWA